MNRAKLIFIVPLLIATAVSFAVSNDADAQIRVEVGVPSVNVYPPSAYIATATPEYFEGRPVYYYGNQWYYRDHGRWNYYRSEPGYLRDRRGHWGNERRYHERVYRAPVRYRYHR